MIRYWVFLLFALCYVAFNGGVRNGLLLQALKFTTAVTLQPFNYALLVFASLIGVFVFRETLDTLLVVGTLLVIFGGKFSVGRNKTS